jgi:hypothetical protein
MDPISIQQKHTTTTIAELWEKYQDDPYMEAKLHNYVCVQLPTIMENLKRTHEERQQRIADLTVEQDEFMERFLNMHRYFHVSTTEKFVSYNGEKYEITAEDNILHHILTTITSEKQLMEWKQRTKVYIMKRIKDNSLLKSVPESKTIQRVLDHLYPALFETKQDAKYFLTILGDGLFRKNGDVVHFIQPRAKAFLREIMNSSLYMFGINTTHTFKYKYYDHNYSLCRLVKINDSVENENIWGNILRNISLDMLCVAAHYSIRYDSSDDYIAKFSNEPTLETYAFFLRNTSQEHLVCRFIEEYLQVSLNGTTQYMNITPSSTPPNASNLLLSFVANPERGGLIEDDPKPDEVGSVELFAKVNTPTARDYTTRQISWKNMHYLWRHFLESQQLPTVIFQQNLKNMLTQKLTDNYKEDTDTFIGVSSRFMPAIRAFIYFWETTVSYEESGEYKIDELCMLYKRWISIRATPFSLRNSCVVSPENIPIPTLVMPRLGIVPFTYDGKPSSSIHPRNALVSAKNSETDKLITFRNEGKEYGALTEKQMIDLITYYFPMTDVEKDKYVFNIRCSLWDKQMDVHTALTQLKESLDFTEQENAPIYATTVYDAYVWYCKYYSEISPDEQPRTNEVERRKMKPIDKHPLVSKSYFEKYVCDTMTEYVVDGKYILREWVTAGRTG